MQQSKGEPIAILNHNRTTAYLIPVETYESMKEKLENYQLGLMVKSRQNEKESTVEANMDDL
jgi:antitoxin StbD